MTKASRKPSAGQTALSSSDAENTAGAGAGTSSNHVFFTQEAVHALKNEFLSISKSFENIFNILCSNVECVSQTPLSNGAEKAIKGNRLSLQYAEVSSTRERVGRVNGFTIYYSEVKPRLDKAHEGQSSKEIYNQAIELWKQESDEKKRGYSLKAMEINQAKFPEAYNGDQKRRKKKFLPTPLAEEILAASSACEEEKDLVLEIKESELHEMEPVIEEATSAVQENEFPAKKKSSKKKDKSQSHQEEISAPSTEILQLSSIEHADAEALTVSKSKRSKTSSKNKYSGESDTPSDRENVPKEAPKPADANVLSQEEWDIMHTLMANKKSKKSKSDTKE